MKELQLTQNEVTVVDDEDFELLSHFKWHVHKDQSGYKQAFIRISLARALVGDVPDGMVVDHINGDSLDNRKENLRIVTRDENRHNSKRNRDGGLPGVSKTTVGESKPWRARYKHNLLGTFDDRFEAYNAYVNAYLEDHDV